MHYIYLLCFWFWMIYIFGSIKITVYYTFYLFICSIICNEITVAIYCQKHVLLIIEPYINNTLYFRWCVTIYIYYLYLIFSSKQVCHTLTSFLLIRSEKLINIRSDKIGKKILSRTALLCKIDAVSTEIYNLEWSWTSAILFSAVISFYRPITEQLHM